MILSILRGIFLVLVAAIITFFVVGDKFNFQQQASLGFAPVAAIIGVTLLVAFTVVALDIGIKRKRLSVFSGVFLGLIAGLVAAYALSFIVDLVGVYIIAAIESAAREGPDAAKIAASRADAVRNLLTGINVIIGVVCCYVAISLVIQTKDDFRFVIPYVEFAKEVRGSRPTLLDTSVIIDGRIVDIVETHVMQGTLIVPRFVLDELQLISDSSDKMKRARGRRGLDILQKLQGLPQLDVTILDQDAEGANVDQKLIALAQSTHARIMTNDFNLNKVAAVREVDVINLNDLAKALQPVVLPGEAMTVRVVKPGESGTQGVGYLDDGTMVVIEGGRAYLHRDVELSVTSTLQTSAGRMVFGKFEREAEDATPAPADSRSADAVEPAADGAHPGRDVDDPPPPQAPAPAAASGPGPAASGAGTTPARATRRASPSRRNPRRG